jgi:hypothetical protein
MTRIDVALLRSGAVIRIFGTAVANANRAPTPIAVFLQRRKDAAFTSVLKTLHCLPSH